MTWALPAALWASLLTIPIILLHVLRPRRTQAEVSATFLWRKVARPVSAAQPWQRLRASWLLLAQLLVALLLAAAWAQPLWLTPQPLAEHTVFVVDASASMAAIDGAPLRLDEAADRAGELYDQIPAGGEASIVVAGDRARVVLSHSTDEGAFTDALARIDTTQGTADFEGAFALAASLDDGRQPQSVVLLSDGGVSDAALRTVPVGTRYERIGDEATNRAITRLTVEPSSGGLVARVTVRNTGGPAASQTLRVDVDGRTVEERTLELEPGELANESFELPQGERIEAFLAGEDLLDVDDRAVATVARRGEITVAWAGPANPFLDALLGSAEGVTVERHDEVPTGSDGLDGVDLLVADRVAVPDDVAVATWAIAPPGGAGGFTTAGTVSEPVVSLLRADRSLLAGLDLVGLGVLEAQRVDAPDDSVVLIGAEGAPLLARRDTISGPVVYQSFALADSTLPLSVEFPLLGERILTDLAGVNAPASNLTVGDTLPLDGRAEARVALPDGTNITVSPGQAAPSASQMGFWTISQDGRADLTVAVNPDTVESDLDPAVSLAIEEPRDGTEAATGLGESPLLRWVLAVVLVLLVVEWFLARRRRGVTPRQWRISTVMRGVVAALAIAAIVGVGFPVSEGRVATIFLLDASDSLGQGGKAEAEAWVREAVASQPDDDLAGIVVFGADARLESLVTEGLDFGGTNVQVDATRSDLAAAVRLGAAVAPNDARRRLVLISDGRATDGDAAEEAARLAEEGVALDVVAIDAGGADDRAVSAVRVPPVARDGDRVPVEIDIRSDVAGPAQVRVTRDGELVEMRDVDLVAGTTTITVTDDEPAGSIARYQVEVRSAGDPVSDNDVGFAAVPVEGAETVLLVEGHDGAADGLAGLLEAAGMEVDRIDSDDLADTSELSRYASIVLVDVDRLSLSDQQVGALTGAVRDLGRGLVTVGGTHAYGLGAYRDSDLEELLPVVSEILDPLRRQTVAEVLAIDTSGSMGACHCADGGMGEVREGGGVNKTDISRTAAARTISALSSNDEVGVLAVSGFEDWVIDLQQLPPEDVVQDGLSRLRPDGSTNLRMTLQTSAEALRESNASLKHIILFTDGFTEPSTLGTLAGDAADLLEEGITVSVVATGEGAAVELEAIAEAGGGRFYPGRNLEQIPEVIVQEAVLASRDFVTEGEFLPEITSSAAPVAGLTSSPPLEGYVATTEKGNVDVMMRIGPDRDPLLASWQVGLGRVTSWTSDGGERWAAPWDGWDGAAEFWSGVVRDTFPVAGGDGGVQASISDGRLDVTVEGAEDWPDGATATVRVSGPDGESHEVTLERVDGARFAGSLEVDEAGTYAIGASVSADSSNAPADGDDGGDGGDRDEDGTTTVWSGVGLATRSYPAEYEPGTTDTAELLRLSELSGGRGEITADQAFDVADLQAGSRQFDLTPWLVALAVLLWPLAVAMSRLAWRRGALAQGAEKARSTASILASRRPRLDDPATGRGVRSRGAGALAP
ncbi:MAG: VWA domain-containing protein, partial [Actinomycetota bacterium]|nr:VWA domain-containing protein [Actinomycetota bacterium]